MLPGDILRITKIQSKGEQRVSWDWTNLYEHIQEDLSEAKVVGQEYSGADKEAAAEIF